MSETRVEDLVRQIDDLLPDELRYQLGRHAGLKVRAGDGGVYLTALNEKEVPVVFSKAHIRWMEEVLVPRFPHVDLRGVLKRNTEIGRQFNSIVHRLERVEALIKKGDCIALESLDLTTGARARPDVRGAAMSVKASKEIPRAITYVRLRPKPATRYIIMSEFPLSMPDGKSIRPDEILARYPVSDEELKAIRAAKRPSPFVPFHLLDKAHLRASELHIHCFDLNKEIQGQTLVDHFTKTMQGLEAATDTVIRKFRITAEGRVFVRASDKYLHSAAVRINRSLFAQWARWSDKETVVRVAAEFEPETVNGERVFQRRERIVRVFSESTSLQVKKKLIPAMAACVNRLEKILNQLRPLK